MPTGAAVARWATAEIVPYRETFIEATPFCFVLLFGPIGAGAEKPVVPDLGRYEDPCP